MQYGDNLTVDSSDEDESADLDNGNAAGNADRGMNDLEAPLMDVHPGPTNRPSRRNGGIISPAFMGKIITDGEKNCIVELVKVVCLDSSARTRLVVVVRRS